MNDPERPKRPAVERTEPHRSWNGGERRAGPPKEAGGDSEQQPFENADSGYQAGYRAINGAYRVIDDFLREGQRMAENLWMPLDRSEAERSSFLAPERFLRSMGDMTMAWMELMQQWASVVQFAPKESPEGFAPPFTAGRAPRNPPVTAEPRPRSHPSLTIFVQAVGRAEASVEFGELSDLSGIVATELRSLGDGVEPIRDVTLRALGNEPPQLTIRIPEHQPAGTYNGLLLEKDSQKPRGAISCRYSGPPSDRG
jgi:hypothetical protein